MGQDKTTFDIIFRGDIVLGHTLSDVKLRLQQLFKADAAKIDALFTGRPVPLKRNLDEATAKKYQAVLQKAGAEVSVKPSGAAAAPPRPVAGKPGDTKPQGEITLAPAGVSLLKLNERQRVKPLEVDTSALSVRPNEGNLVDHSEISDDTPVEVVAPDFDVAEVGADMLPEQDRMNIPLPEIEPADWGLSQEGETLLRPEESTRPAAAVVKDLDADLAPVGSDMGQQKIEKEALNPDISKLKLEER